MPEPAPSPRTTSPAPTSARSAEAMPPLRTRILDVYECRADLLLVSDSWNMSAQERQEAVIAPCDEMLKMILDAPVTCAADLAAQILADTENGGFEMSEKMLDRLRALVSKEDAA